MDPWNPLIAETHVEYVPFWQLFGLYILSGLGLLAGTFVVAVLILSLERAS